MKRVVVPIEHFHHSEADPVAAVLLTMGPDTIGYEGKIRTDEDAALHGSPVAKPPHEGLIVTVPEDMPLEWVAKMVQHALKDVGLEKKTGRAYAVE